MKTTGLNFIEAVQAAKEKKQIQRASWGNSAVLFLLRDTLVYGDCSGIFQGYIGDILATDWEIVPERPKTMGFTEAVEMMKTGKSVRRLSWTNENFRTTFDVHRNFIGRSSCREGWHDVCPIGSLLDIEATDWVVVEESER